MRRTHHGDDGATAVEFSLIATLLFMLLFGILHFGLAYNRQQGLHAAAREGARLASLGATVDYDAVLARVQEAAPAFVAQKDLTTATVTIQPSDWCSETAFEDAPSGGTPTVSVGVDLNVLDAEALDRYRVNIPGLNSFLPDFTVVATFMCETARTGGS